MKLAIVIPAFNEESSVGDVVKQLVTQFGADVLVIDDFSTDSTADIAKANGAKVVSLAKNCGYNFALHTGIKYAKEKGYTHAITIDADGQHPPIYVDQFIKYFDQGIPFVFGKRNQCARWAEKLFSAYTFLRFRLSDPLCGMKGYDLQTLSHLGNFPSYDSSGTELLLKVVNRGYAWRQIDINQRERENESRFGQGIRPNLKILYALVKGVFT